MLEINRLYRIIGKCEEKLNLSQNPETPPVFSPAFLTLHKNVIVGAALLLALLLLAIRASTSRRLG
jgi:hypothetical protein